MATFVTSSISGIRHFTSEPVVQEVKFNYRLHAFVRPAANKFLVHLSPRMLDSFPSYKLPVVFHSQGIYHFN